MKKQTTKKRKPRAPTVKTKQKIQMAYGLLIAISFISVISVAAAATVSLQKKSNNKQSAAVSTCRQQSTNFQDRLACVIKKFKDRKEKDPEPLYLVTALKRLPDGGTCQANDINEKNEITGYCENADGHFRAVVWQASGAVKELPLPENEASFGTVGHAINDDSRIAGQSQLLDQQLLHAMTSSKDVTQSFAPFVVQSDSEIEADDHSFVYGINKNNQMVGSGPYKLIDIEDIGDKDDKKMVHHAFLWENSTVTDLDAVGEGFSSWAKDINDTSLIVGEAELPLKDNKYSNRAAVWSADEHTITILDQRENAAATSALLAVNDAQPAQAVGRMGIEQWPGTFYSHGFLWTGGEMKDLGTYENCAFSSAKDINNSSNIVGESWGYPCSEELKEYKALIWTFKDNQQLVTDINEFISNNQWHLSILTGINDANLIVGYGTFNDKEEAFLLTPNK